MNDLGIDEKRCRERQAYWDEWVKTHPDQEETDEANKE